MIDTNNLVSTKNSFEKSKRFWQKTLDYQPTATPKNKAKRQIVLFVD